MLFKVVTSKHAEHGMSIYICMYIYIHVYICLYTYFAHPKICLLAILITPFLSPFCCCFCLVLSCARLFLNGAEHCTCRNNLAVLSMVIFLVGWFITIFDSWMSRCSVKWRTAGWGWQ